MRRDALSSVAASDRRRRRRGAGARRAPRRRARRRRVRRATRSRTPSPATRRGRPRRGSTRRGRGARSCRARASSFSAYVPKVTSTAPPAGHDRPEHVTAERAERASRDRERRERCARREREQHAKEDEPGRPRDDPIFDAYGAAPKGDCSRDRKTILPAIPLSRRRAPGSGFPIGTPPSRRPRVLLTQGWARNFLRLAARFPLT